MGFGFKAVCFVYVQVCYLMHIGDQKFKLGKIAVNCNARLVATPACKISRLGDAFFTEVKLKRILLPELNTILQRSSRKIRLELLADQSSLKT